jgi:hypothetical protein
MPSNNRLTSFPSILNTRSSTFCFRLTEKITVVRLFAGLGEMDKLFANPSSTLALSSDEKFKEDVISGAAPAVILKLKLDISKKILPTASTFMRAAIVLMFGSVMRC